MTDRDLLDRIALDPRIVTGKPVIKGTRLTVEFVIGLLAHGMTLDEFCAEYPGIAPEDIRACLLFGNKTVEPTIESGS